MYWDTCAGVQYCSTGMDETLMPLGSCLLFAKLSCETNDQLMTLIHHQLIRRLTVTCTIYRLIYTHQPRNNSEMTLAILFSLETTVSPENSTVFNENIFDSVIAELLQL